MITQRMLDLPNQNLWSRASKLRHSLEQARLCNTPTRQQSYIVKEGLYFIVEEMRKLPREGEPSPEYVTAWHYVCNAYEYAKNIKYKDGNSLGFLVKMALEAVEAIESIDP